MLYSHLPTDFTYKEHHHVTSPALPLDSFITFHWFFIDAAIIIYAISFSRLLSFHCISSITDWLRHTPIAAMLLRDVLRAAIAMISAADCDYVAFCLHYFFPLMLDGAIARLLLLLMVISAMSADVMLAIDTYWWRSILFSLHMSHYAISQISHFWLLRFHLLMPPSITFSQSRWFSLAISWPHYATITPSISHGCFISHISERIAERWLFSCFSFRYFQTADYAIIDATAVIAD